MKKKYFTDEDIRLNKIWKDIKRRCNPNNNKDSKHYSDKGIIMCEEWDDFDTFKKWSLTNGFNDTKQIDKDIKCDMYQIEPKIYSPETCIWVPKKTNIIYTNTSRSNHLHDKAVFRKSGDELFAFHMSEPVDLSVKNATTEYVSSKDFSTPEELLHELDRLLSRKKLLTKKRRRDDI